MIFRVAILVGAMSGVTVGASAATGNTTWPSNALQILATLLIALTVESRAFGLFDDRTWVPREEANVARLLTVLIWAAILVSLIYASAGNAFTPPIAGFVAGVIAALVSVVLAYATGPRRPRE